MSHIDEAVFDEEASETSFDSPENEESFNQNDPDDESAPLDDQALLDEIVLALVQHKDDMHIDKRTNDHGTLLLIHCHPDDRGRVIGRNGCNITSIQQLFHSIGTFDNKRKIAVRLAS